VEEVEAQIWAAIARHTEANDLRGALFGPDGLLVHYLAFLPTNATRIREVTEQVFKRLADLDKQVELDRSRFEESKDRGFADWKRVRSAIEHENTLTNHRLTWLLTSQAFLFAALGVIFAAWAKNEIRQPHAVDKVKVVLSCICFVGLLMCLSVHRTTKAARIQLETLDDWWHKTRRLPRINPDHPEIQGWRVGWFEPVINSAAIPAWLGAVWLALFAIMALIDSSAEWMDVVLFMALGALCLLLVVVLFFERFTIRQVVPQPLVSNPPDQAQSARRSQ
jgi:hypothetical protein